MNVFLSSIKKKAMDKTLSTSCLSPPRFLSPNRHWKRGVGRDGTPLKNAAGHNAKNSINVDSSRQNIFFRFKVEEILQLLENMCEKIQEKDLVTLYY